MSKFNLSQGLVIKIADVNYQIKYPNVGEILEIDNKKMLLTNGKYAEYIASSVMTKSLKFVIELVDAISHFSVLIPALTKQLDVNSYLDIDLVTGKELVKVYKEQFEPWYEELMKFIHDVHFDDVSLIKE